MEYNQICYVLAVAETCNFSRAAEQLFVAQPTLSQQISKLEQELGIELFDRTTRSVQLTEAGQAFVEDAKTLQCSWKRLAMTTEHYRDLHMEKIFVGLLPTLGRTHLVQSIPDFTLSFPNTRVELITGYSHTLLHKLNSGEIDIGIINVLPFKTKNTVNLVIYPLEENPITVIMHKDHPLATRSAVTLEDISDLPILALNNNASVRICMDWVFEKNKIKPHIVCECEMDTLADLVSANMGISFLTTRVAKHQAGICAVPLTPPVITYTSIVIRKEKNVKLCVKEFRNHLIAAFKK